LRPLESDLRGRGSGRRWERVAPAHRIVERCRPGRPSQTSTFFVLHLPLAGDRIEPTRCDTLTGGGLRRSMPRRGRTRRKRHRNSHHLVRDERVAPTNLASQKGYREFTAELHPVCVRLRCRSVAAHAGRRIGPCAVSRCFMRYTPWAGSTLRATQRNIQASLSLFASMAGSEFAPSKYEIGEIEHG
jgi:hypothetical protein